MKVIWTLGRFLFYFLNGLSMLNVPKKMVMNILQYLILNKLLNINLIFGAYFIFRNVFTKDA